MWTLNRCCDGDTDSGIRCEPYEECPAHETGEQVLISDGTGKDYTADHPIDSEAVGSHGIRSVRQRREESCLPESGSFRDLPKSDKMEFIIQKAVELGAAGIVPVTTRNTVVKLDPKKGRGQGQAWQAIAGSAAKQSNGAWFPGSCGIMTLKEAFDYVESQEFSVRLIPYEHEAGWSGRKTELAAGRAGHCCVYRPGGRF